MQRKYVLNETKLFSLETVNDLQISAVISVYRRFSCGLRVYISTDDVIEHEFDNPK